MPLRRLNRVARHRIGAQPPKRRLFGAIALASLAFSLAACSGMFAPKDDTPSASQEGQHGVESILVPVNGSAVDGKLRAVDKGDGISLLISAHNMPMVPMVPTNEYRIVFTERALCNSSNGFSAGPPWAPPGLGRDPATIVPSFWATGEDLGWVEVHVSGVHTTGDNGLSGRGALVYNGLRLDPVVPGVPNNAVACAAFEPTKPILF